MTKISRDPSDLVAQTIGASHAYPDGFVLLLGTMFAPVADRGAAGMGFTHRSGDIVTISAEKLGRLVNCMRPCDECERWTLRSGRADAQSRPPGVDLSTGPRQGCSKTGDM